MKPSSFVVSNALTIMASVFSSSIVTIPSNVIAIKLGIGVSFFISFSMMCKVSSILLKSFGTNLCNIFSLLPWQRTNGMSGSPLEIELMP